jgi:small-conductance mechanosensitive channel
MVLLAQLDRLVPQLGGLSLPAQLALTAVLVVLGALCVSGGRLLQRRIETTFVRPAITVCVIALLGALGVVFVSVWNAWNELEGVAKDLSIQRRAPELAITIPLLVLAHAGSTIIREAIRNVFERRDGVTVHQQQTTYRISQLLIWTTTLIVVLGVWEINLQGLLIGAGFLGIVVGMAARQTLGNVLAGLVLLFTRPFEIGDWVAIGDDEGVVTDVTIVNTHLRTFYGEDVVVPNDLVQDTHVVNRSRRGRLLVEVEVGVAYETDLDHAIEASRAAVAGLDELTETPEPEVARKRFGDSSIVLGVRGWIDSPTASRRDQARSAMVDAITTAFDREGITIPFPQRTITTTSADGDIVTPVEREAGDQGSKAAEPTGSHSGPDQSHRGETE